MAKKTYIVLATIVGLVICYAPTLRGMVDQWWNDEDMTHAFLVPLVILWILWRERARWRALPPSPSAWGIAVLASAAALQVLGTLGVGLFLNSVSLLLAITGIGLSLYGWALLRTWRFSFLLSFFMLPKLAIVYNQATLPLQLLASRLAAGLVTAAGFVVIREGNILDVGGHRVTVAEACSGVRYLLPLCFMALVFGYLWDQKGWMRVVLLVTAIPVAILANAVRVAAAVSLPLLDGGPPHAVMGCLLFALSVGALVITCRLLNAVLGYRHA